MYNLEGIHAVIRAAEATGRSAILQVPTHGSCWQAGSMIGCMRPYAFFVGIRILLYVLSLWYAALLELLLFFFLGAHCCLFLARNISLATKYKYCNRHFPARHNPDIPGRGGLWNVRATSFRA